MAIPVIMPRQGQSVETCIITKLFKQKGETVRTGDLLFSYETDKAAFDVESPADGIVLDILFTEGAEVPVLANVAFIGAQGETIESGPHSPGAGNTTTEEIRKPPETKTEYSPVLIPEPDAETVDPRIRISPKAKRYAEKKNLNYKGIQGSGPNGRIICGDIEKALSGLTFPGKEATAPPDEFTEQPLSNIRKLIARTMHASLQNSAQLTHHMSADARNILSSRKRIKDRIQSNQEVQDITLNDIICFCVIKAIKKFPEINTHFLDDRIKIFNKVHLGIAVDTPRGLMVPSVRNADEMDLRKLSRELKSSADACKKGNINPELIQSTAASFTISNLGNYGVEMFTPVINLPQTAILGVCTIINRPADLGNNTFGFVPYIGLSLTYDHRAVDGGPATLFLREIKNQIEIFSYGE